MPKQPKLENVGTPTGDVAVTTQNELAKVLLISFTSLFAGFRLASWFGDFSENSLDNYMELSFIKLNKGDAKEIADAERRNRNYIFKTIGGLIGALFLGILSSIIAGYISNLN